MSTQAEQSMSLWYRFAMARHLKSAFRLFGTRAMSAHHFTQLTEEIPGAFALEFLFFYFFK